jgi:hypothetical protein
MGSITMTLVGDVSVGTKTKTYTASDADINRFIAWAKVAYATAAVPNPTTAQAAVAWADAQINAMKMAVQAYEGNVARAAVVDPTWTAT